MSQAITMPFLQSRLWRLRSHFLLPPPATVALQKRAVNCPSDEVRQGLSVDLHFDFPSSRTTVHKLKTLAQTDANNGTNNRG